jgi:Ca2+/Na+ antiporter
MVLLRTFSAGSHGGDGLGPTDLYIIGALLLLVQVVGMVELIKRFGSTPDRGEWVSSVEEAEEADEVPVPVSRIAAFGALGLGTSVIGGHAVGDFANILVLRLAEAGYSEMVGALVLSIFACAGGYIMIASAHMRGMYDLALANVSGAITQNAVLVMPIALIMLAVFAQLGVIAALPSGAVLPIDLETTSVVLLMFPPLLILWKAVKDDGRVSWVESASMVAVFGLTLYFLAEHG